MMQMPASRVAESAANEEMVVVVLIMICCVFFILAGFGAAWFGQGKKGDKCKGPVENAKYELDERLECQYLGCNEGYGLDGTGTCVLDQSGKDCQGSITNAIYETDVSNVCVFMTCNYGYQIDENGVCVKIEEESAGGGAGAEAGGLTSYVPTNETPTNATPTVMTGGELTTVGTVVTTPTTSPAENVGSYTPADAGGPAPEYDTTTSDLTYVGDETKYSGVITGKYEWTINYQRNTIYWNGEMIETFDDPNYNFLAGQSGGITYYEKGIYAYHRWPDVETDIDYKLIKTPLDPSQSQPDVTIVTLSW